MNTFIKFLIITFSLSIPHTYCQVNIEWVKYYPNGFGNIRFADEYYVIVYRDTLYKYSLGDDIIWKKRHLKPNTILSSSFFEVLLNDSDDIYLVCAYYDTISQINSRYIVKFNSSGDTLWWFPIASFEMEMDPTGFIYVYTGSYDLSRISPSGNLLWAINILGGNIRIDSLSNSCYAKLTIDS